MKDFYSKINKLRRRFLKQRETWISENPDIQPTLKIIFFTGAGVSVESGLHTYRSADGLWNNYPVDEVATSHAIKVNTDKVNGFFNELRKNIKESSPNKAHLFIKNMEKYFHVRVITQNIDNLHERAGVSEENIFHLHGSILKSRPMANTKINYDQFDDILPDERCALTNSRLRPSVVLFGETPLVYNESLKEMAEADLVVVIGTSLQVNPAAMLLTKVLGKKPVYIIDPNPNLLKELEVPEFSNLFHIIEKAGTGVELLEKKLREAYNLPI
jgi:NAD-dependent deacetylase